MQRNMYTHEIHMHVKNLIHYAVVHMHGCRIPTKLDWHAACGDSQSRQESHTLVAQVFATCCLFIEYQKRGQLIFRLHNSSLRSCYHEHRTYFWLQPCKNGYIIQYHALKIIIELGSILLDERLNFCKPSLFEVYQNLYRISTKALGIRLHRGYRWMCLLLTNKKKEPYFIVVTR